MSVPGQHRSDNASLSARDLWAKNQNCFERKQSAPPDQSPYESLKSLVKTKKSHMGHLTGPKCNFCLTRALMPRIAVRTLHEIRRFLEELVLTVVTLWGLWHVIKVLFFWAS